MTAVEGWVFRAWVKPWTAAGTRQPDPERAAPAGTVRLSMSAQEERKKRKRKEYLTVKDLQKLLDSCTLHLHQVDEVWPKIYIGNAWVCAPPDLRAAAVPNLRLCCRAVAHDKAALKNLGITHVLNAAHAKRGSVGNQNFYGSSFVYCGIPADDSTHFDLDVYFQPAADFIHKALKSPDGKFTCFPQNSVMFAGCPSCPINLQHSSKINSKFSVLILNKCITTSYQTV